MIRNIYWTVLLCFYSSYLCSQARLVINNDAYLMIENGGDLVIQNGNANAVVTMGSGGNIISEGEQNKIHWEIGENLGTYTLPFTTTPSAQGGNSTKIPFSMEITSQGSGSGSFTFSTYETSTDQNAPFPTGVTNMTNAQGQDGSLSAVDRFWIIEPSSYTTAPDVKMTFGYDEANNENGGNNIITEANLQAQRWNATLSSWEAQFFGVSDPSNNLVTNVAIPGSGFHKIWTLAANQSVLPVELVSFNGVCQENAILLTWKTASKLNNNYFQIEKSKDGITFVPIGTVDGVGNSTTVNEYDFTDTDFQRYDNTSTYYRLKQFDLDGINALSQVIVVPTCSDLESIYFEVFPNPTSEMLNLRTNGMLTEPLQIFDKSGQLIREVYPNGTLLLVEFLDSGSYYLKAQFDNQVITKRFVIID
ncbi:MAG: T9SS type A sorting domain-containing protein [Bacteroidota bacterium]